MTGPAVRVEASGLNSPTSKISQPIAAIWRDTTSLVLFNRLYANSAADSYAVSDGCRRLWTHEGTAPDRRKMKQTRENTNRATVSALKPSDVRNNLD